MAEALGLGAVAREEMGEKWWGKSATPGMMLIDNGRYADAGLTSRSSVTSPACVGSPMVQPSLVVVLSVTARYLWGCLGRIVY